MVVVVVVVVAVAVAVAVGGVDCCFGLGSFLLLMQFVFIDFEKVILDQAGQVVCVCACVCACVRASVCVCARVSVPAVCPSPATSQKPVDR